MTAEEIRALARHSPDLGLGVAGGYRGLVPIDVDTDDPAIVRTIVRALPSASVVKAGRKGYTSFYRAAGDVPPARKYRLVSGGPPIVEILTTGQTVIPPTVHPDTGAPYSWKTPATLYSRPVGNLVRITADDLDRLAAAVRSLRPPAPRQEPTHRAGHAHPPLPVDRAVRDYVSAMVRREAAQLAATPEGGRHNGLMAAACRLGAIIHHGAVARATVEAALVEAAKMNGLWAHEGDRIVRLTIAAGIKRAENDPLPNRGPLRYWGRSDGR
jgi:hypothetical protein